MHTKAKMALLGALVSLVSGSTGTYFYLTQETDIDRVLSLVNKEVDVRFELIRIQEQQWIPVQRNTVTSIKRMEIRKVYSCQS
ncbi:hypothetical protein MHF_0197 [Mycoplasma haemofelis Ohio2]|uniref:Uncharacterized protein n=1 Tax=Mycoplasma haemofelis (strain Ohio2) TaxID=859194 RepID=F6FG30_MYCHI|nr:hypothetical protein MHF_0197 [Mycoplasma haemofelis Ohio2]